MSSYAPPTENVAIFDTINFTSGEETLTQQQADKRYLRFPNAQGTENLQVINVNGLATFNNDILQVGSTNNITQDQQTNTDPNILKATDIYGDLNVRKPTSSSGGALRLWAVNGGSSNSSQIYTTGTQMALVNLNNSGAITFDVKDGAGNNSEVLQLGSASATFLTNINASKPLTMNGTLTDRTINNVYYQLQDATLSSTTTGKIYADNAIMYYDNDLNGGFHRFATNSGGTQSFPLEISSAAMTISTLNFPVITSTPIPIASDSSTKIATTAWVQTAISAAVPPNLLVSNNTWTGTNSFTNTATGSLTSSAVQPAANDSSTKVPTTAWVQSAISAIPSVTQFVPKFVNYTDVQTGTTGYSNGPQINFGGTWTEDDIVYFRVTSQVSFGRQGGTGQYQSTGATSGIIYFRPHYFSNGWAPVAPTLSPVQIYPTNSGGQGGAFGKPFYYLPSFNIGNSSLFYLNDGGTTSVRVSVTAPGTPGGWEFFVSLEYLGARTDNGIITFSNGADSTGRNNILP